MYKFAEEVKEAEVRGCIAAWIDAGHIKVASEEAFDDLCEVVSSNLGTNYDLNKVAAVTEAVLSGGMQKTAANAERARNAALGELLLMKTAGEIDDATFVKTARDLMKIADDFMDRFGEATDKKYISRDAIARSNAMNARAQAEAAQAAENEALKGIRSRQGNISAEDAAEFAKKHQARMADSNGRGNARFDNEVAEKRLAAQKAQSREVLKNRAIKGLKGLGALGVGGTTLYLGKQLYDKYAE